MSIITRSLSYYLGSLDVEINIDKKNGQPMALLRTKGSLNELREWAEAMNINVVKFNVGEPYNTIACSKYDFQEAVQHLSNHKFNMFAGEQVSDMVDAVNPLALWPFHWKIRYPQGWAIN